MSPELQHPSQTGRGTSLAEPPRQPGHSQPSVDLIDWPAARRADRACCCTAGPVVIAVVPPARGRPHQTDLLFCGHHYRVSRQSLTAAGAVMVDMAGDQLDPDEWPGTRATTDCRS
jgi:hypothetical protein